MSTDPTLPNDRQPSNEESLRSDALPRVHGEDILAWKVAEKATKILLRHASVLAAATLVLGFLGLKSYRDALADITSKSEKAARDIVEKKSEELTEKMYKERLNAIVRRIENDAAVWAAKSAEAQKREEEALLALANKTALATKAPELVRQVRQILAASEMPKSSAWVYLGSRRNHKWGEKFFSVTDVPQTGVEVTALGDVFERANHAQYANGEWAFSEIVGLIRKGQQIRVNATEKVPDEDGVEHWYASVVR